MNSEMYCPNNPANTFSMVQNIETPKFVINPVYYNIPSIVWYEKKPETISKLAFSKVIQPEKENPKKIVFSTNEEV